MRKSVLLAALLGIAASDLAGAVSASPNARLDGDQLGGSLIKRLATRFDTDIRQHGAAGLWVDVQSCYARASSKSNKRREIGQCLILDEAGKIMDDAHVRHATKPGAATANKDWYRGEVFDTRIQKYARLGFGGVDAATSFVNKNMPAFLDAISKLG